MNCMHIQAATAQHGGTRPAPDAMLSATHDGTGLTSTTVIFFQIVFASCRCRCMLLTTSPPRDLEIATAHHAEQCGKQLHGIVRVFAVIVTRFRITGPRSLRGDSGRDRMPRVTFVTVQVHVMNVSICAEITDHASYSWLSKRRLACPDHSCYQKGDVPQKAFSLCF